jgi:glycolate oxidase iron-sulfur subunit
MQTNFTLAQLADPDVAEANRILRACVHCGFCTATCPTYVLLGDELDSPRGRIYLMKDMLENDKPATARLVTHVDRCLTCLSCMTTCPSGVHYMHLVDQTRVRIEESFTRPLTERALRRILALIVPRPGLFRLALFGAWYAKGVLSLAKGATLILGFPDSSRLDSGPPKATLFRRLRALFELTPGTARPPSPVDRPQVFPAEGPRRARVALMSGCAQRVLAPEINEATVRLLTRHGVEVVVARGAGCCGALTHHLGMEAAALASAKANIAAWSREFEGEGLDAVVINASGCGTTVKDYGYMLRGDTDWADRARRISGLTKDISELMDDLGLMTAVRPRGLTVAYHSACSMQHGQQIRRQPKDLLTTAGFTVKDVPEGHLCCGSAGTYNLLQPEIAGRLRARKLANLQSLEPDVIATGNIGCITQLAGGTDIPVVHSIELLDWATGGPSPPALQGLDSTP